jgi:hypothetical protein
MMSGATAPFFPEVIVAWKATSILYGDEIPAKEFLHAASKFVPIFGIVFLYGYLIFVSFVRYNRPGVCRQIGSFIPTCKG